MGNCNGQWVMSDWESGLTAAASHGRQESTLPTNLIFARTGKFGAWN